MKKLLILAAAVLMLLVFTACSGDDSTSSVPDTAKTDTEVSAEKGGEALTALTEKNGSWRLNIISEKEISVVKFSLSGEDGELLCLRGAPYDTYDKALTDQRPEDCETVNDVKYWYEVGDSCYLSCTVSDNTVTFYSDEFDMKLVLTRTEENSMQLTAAENVPPRFYELKEGQVFSFEPAA